MKYCCILIRYDWKIIIFANSFMQTQASLTHNTVIYSNTNLFCVNKWLSIPADMYVTGRSLVNILTHWGPDKMDAISQTTFSSAFSWMKMFEFHLRYPKCPINNTMFQHWFRWWLGAVQATSHYLNQWWLFYRRIYASLGLNELKSNDQPYRICPLYYLVFVSNHCFGLNVLTFLGSILLIWLWL